MFRAARITEPKQPLSSVMFQCISSQCSSFTVSTSLKTWCVQHEQLHMHCVCVCVCACACACVCVCARKWTMCVNVCKYSITMV